MSAGDIAHVFRGLDNGPDRKPSLVDTELILPQSGDTGQGKSTNAGPEITLMTNGGPSRHMSKKIFLDEHGALHSD